MEDTGPGIPPEQLNALFNRFSQLDSSFTRAHDGAGLGLAISRELARAMQGEISVESTVDRGSIFTLKVTLPSAEGETHRFTDRVVVLNRTIPVFQPDSDDLIALENALIGTDCQIVACPSIDSVIESCPPISRSRHFPSRIPRQLFVRCP